MAQIEQNRVQESRAIQSGVQYNTPARKAYDTPNQMAGAVEGQKAQAWDKTADAIGSLGLIGAKLNEGRERLVADGIKEDMLDHHRMEMKTLIDQTKNTSIENLDFGEMLNGWEDRQSNDFMVGPNGKDGKPSIKIKGKALEDYDLPSTQKRELENFYKNLSQKGTEWIFSNVPEIQTKKDLFALAKMGSDAHEEVESIFRDINNYEGGIDAIWTEGEEVVDRATGEPVIFNKTPYTNELGILAQQKVNKILTDYDLEIMKRMDAGTLPLEDAIELQRTFSVGILNRQFTNDKLRSPEETFLKVQKHGYAIERDLRVGRGPAQEKIMQKVVLPSKNTDPFMNTWSSRLHRELRQEKDLTDKQALLEKGLRLHEVFATDEFLDNPNNTIDSVRQSFKATGITKYEASVQAHVWSRTNKAYDTGKDTEFANNIIKDIGLGFIRNGESMVKLLSKRVGDDNIALNQNQLEKVLLKQIRSNKGKFRKSNGNHYTASEEAAAVKHITSGDIQGLLIKKDSNDVSWEMEAYHKGLTKQMLTPGGQAQLVKEFFKFNENNDTWVVREEGHPDGSFHNHPNRKRFGSDEHMVSVLEAFAIKMTDEYHNGKKGIKTPEAKDIAQKKRFEGFMGKYRVQQTQSYYNLFTAKSKKEAEDDADIGDTLPYLDLNMRDTALEKGYSEEEFKAMTPDQKMKEFLSAPQRERYEGVKGDFETLSSYIQLSLPHENTKVEELNGILNSMNKDSHGERLNNIYTSEAIGLITKFVQARIDSLHPTKMWATFMLECNDDKKCANNKRDIHNVPIRGINPATAGEDAAGDNSLGIE